MGNSPKVSSQHVAEVTGGKENGTIFVLLPTQSYHPKEVETIYFINFQPPSNKNGETSFTMDVNVFNVLPSYGIELPDAMDLHVMKCLSEIREMPRYTLLMLHSSSWQSGLMARIELEIDIVTSKLSEQWKQVEGTADVLNNFVAADCQSQRTTPLSFLRQDLQHILSYLVVEVMKWFEIDDKVTCPAVIASIKPNVNVEKAIARCKQSLKTTAHHMSKKS
ncbi:hypothetical protein WUBG_10332 [Wuchereria bancrofti]|uniref:Uncharacterized protein n=1 Tax=Wuchereria bancrofti TaxID=6293 RepID=J9ENZ4_WUCBA|nr:hypothetical protein WUBG_10332 [Wuchereria bancrofti]